MNKQEALDLIDELSGDELAWVDFKEDYEVGGIAKKKAEFIKDVCSLSNTLVEKEERYIIVGCDDDGELVGYDEEREEYRGDGPRHIISYDESDIQEWITDNLEPAPVIEFRTFRTDQIPFGVLTVLPVDAPPSIIKQDLFDSNNTQYLHKGRFYIRRGSGKEIGSHEDLERILQNRISSRREEILDGVEKAIHLGPEFIERLSSGTTDSGIEISESEDSDLEVKQRLTRQPASTLDQELNEDIASKYRSRGFTGAIPTWRYYESPNSLSTDKEACEYLYNCGLKHNVLGTLWLTELTEDLAVSLIPEIPEDRQRGELAAKIATLRGDEELLEQIEDQMRYGPSTETREYHDIIDNNVNNRINHLRFSSKYDIGYADYNDSFTLRKLSARECKEKISQIAEQLQKIEEKLSTDRNFRGRRDKFREAIHDLELQLAKETWGIDQ